MLSLDNKSLVLGKFLDPHSHGSGHDIGVHNEVTLHHVALVLIMKNPFSF